MKPIKLSDFRPNKRNIARDMWGEVGGSIKTTSRKASYYHCSGHGGYVCNPKDFTEKECSIMGDSNYDLKIAIAVDCNNTEWVVGVDYPYTRSRSHSIPWKLIFKEWRTYPMYVFEEDCNWAILTYATGIDLVEFTERFTKEERLESVISTLKQWNAHILKK